MRYCELKQIARSFLCDQIALESCDELPEGLYGFKHDEDVLFLIRSQEQNVVGGSNYIAVSKKTGAVHYHGTLGE